MNDETNQTGGNVNLVSLSLVGARKSEAEIALDLKRRVEAAMTPVLALMDEAAAQGMQVQWDAIVVSPVKHGILNLRIMKHY